MTMPALVLVHGGSVAADCWEPTVDVIHRVAPQLKVLAVDLPGRRDKPGDLFTASIDEWADSVVADIENSGFAGDLVIVGHSFAGVTVPAVVRKLGAARVREMILATAYIPPDGAALVDTMPGALGWYARRTSLRNLRKRTPGGLPATWARLAFCNGMSPAQRDFTLARSYPESPCIALERVDRSGMPDVPRTWILTQRDRAMSVKVQHQCIAALGGVQTLIEVDTCHMLMVSEPKRLAEILVERCRVYE
jgi:pimeloyl-ACP methyl ester carboxylesterase